MRAKVTKFFPGVKDGEIYPQDFLPGDEVEGDLAKTAVEAGNADWLEQPTEEEREAMRRGQRPMPPQPNNPPSAAAVGVAGLPAQPAALSHPRLGSEPAVPAAATDDGGATTVEGPDTPTGGKLHGAAADDAVAHRKAAEEAAADLKRKTDEEATEADAKRKADEEAAGAASRASKGSRRTRKA